MDNDLPLVVNLGHNHDNLMMDLGHNHDNLVIDLSHNHHPLVMVWWTWIITTATQHIQTINDLHAQLLLSHAHNVFTGAKAPLPPSLTLGSSTTSVL